MEVEERDMLISRRPVSSSSDDIRTDIVRLMEIRRHAIMSDAPEAESRSPPPPPAPLAVASEVEEEGAEEEASGSSERTEEEATPVAADQEATDIPCAQEEVVEASPEWLREKDFDCAEIDLEQRVSFLEKEVSGLKQLVQGKKRDVRPPRTMPPPSKGKKIIEVEKTFQRLKQLNH